MCESSQLCVYVHFGDWCSGPLRVSVSRWCVFCVPTRGVVTSVCKWLCRFLFCITFKGILSSQQGVCVFIVLFSGKGGIVHPREAVGILGSAPSGLCAEWRPRLRHVPCRLVPRWLEAGCGGQGRAGAAVGTGPAPGLWYKYPGLPAAVFTRPQPGGGGSPAGPRGWG